MPTMALAISAPFGIASNVLLVHGPSSVRMGFIGAPIASVVIHVLNVSERSSSGKRG